MSLDDLDEDITDVAGELGESIDVTLDRETRTELAMLTAALGPTDPDELVRRAVHAFFQQQVDTGRLDFQLRDQYDVTYDEYLSGMTFDEMTGGTGGIGGATQGDPDDRRYQF
ncbi:hypothetical protein [Halapricum hydrolyticum]|uniref:Uncharacterized protein n=1 Tax=Halapricum hydrolyticum TaxID=2979991 RepID=A0AAE3IB12_9EURY|nr:hypothetical protein [Halapricum hydrolyticum]MCU4718398.1 hypothetical protein [Halapricum hydrolyticum]MCU4726489.1 hypothetical protein [Halapricum hydrolyticum]